MGHDLLKRIYKRHFVDLPSMRSAWEVVQARRVQMSDFIIKNVTRVSLHETTMDAMVSEG